MESFRKWLNKPKADDRSLLARFYHADRALQTIASELDSFDGRAEPDRCSRLVSRLRQGQDKVLSVTNQIMDQLLADERIPRGFRVKFPEEVLQENLGGQLWFGAECLAAGSSIMHREAESTAMRPLAQAVTKSLENVRNLLRHQCLTNNVPNSDRLHLDINDPATEQLYESLKIFDRLFAEFELKYVSAMTQVKSTHEYEMQEMICVLFSESLQRALKIGLLEQDQVDEFDPPLMFSIPRIAIICGLIIYPEGPLNMDVVADDLSEMFRPFRTILIKIRDLLRTLSPNELYSLEKLLCTNEDKNSCFTKSTTSSNDEIPKKLEGICLNNNYTAPLASAIVKSNVSDEVQEEYDSMSEDEKYLNDSTSTDIDEWSDDHSDTDEDNDSREGVIGGFLMANTNLGNLFQTTDQGPLATVSNFIPFDQITQIIGNNNEANNNNNNLMIYPSCSTNVVSTGRSSPSSTESVKITLRRKDMSIRKHYTSTTSSITNSVGSNSSTEENHFTSSKCSNVRKVKHGRRKCKSISEKEMREQERLIEGNEKMEKEKLMSARMKFKNTENLLHRLFVCIAGVADQLQTNFASDLRHILRSVFLMNISISEEEEPLKVSENTSKDTENLYEFLASENDVVQRGNNNEDDDIDDSSQNVYSAEEVNAESDLSSSGDQRSEASENNVNGNDIESVINNNASVVNARKNSIPSTSSNRSSPANNSPATNTPASPPIWIPDQDAPSCMGCTTPFTAFRRRHHCRNCGRVFCGSCSNTSAPLPKFGLIKAVRVCRQCYITEATSAAVNSL